MTMATFVNRGASPFFLSLALAACADFGAPIGGGGGGAPLSPQEQRLQAIEARLGDVTRKVDNLSFAAQSQDITKLEQDVRDLRGQVEQLRYDLDNGAKRSRELYTDLDKRVTLLENASRSAHLSMAPQIAQPPPVPASQEEESTYLATFDKLKAQKYDDAIAGFKDQLQKWPDGKYADNAWYWLGEAHFVKREYGPALAAFQSVVAKNPPSPKAPDALLKVGMTQLEQKKKDDARATFQKVIKDYPDSSAATLARQRLDQLKK